MSSEIEAKQPFTPLPLTPERAARLVLLEGTVDQAITSGRNAGLALMEIRDSKLYKASHKTFEAYCIAKWGYKRDYAYKLISGAALANEMSTIGYIPNESVARELKKVAPEKRDEVFKTALGVAKSAGRRVTAKDIGQTGQPLSAKMITTPKTVESAKAQTPEPEAVNTVATPKVKSPRKKTESKTKAAVSTGQPTTSDVTIPPASITAQLKNLWAKANETERENFLAWVDAQTAAQGVAHFECENCETTFENDTDVVTIYECQECGDKYTSDMTSSGTHRCDSCKTFGSIFTRCGCPECKEGEVHKTSDEKA